MPDSPGEALCHAFALGADRLTHEHLKSHALAQSEREGWEAAAVKAEE